MFKNPFSFKGRIRRLKYGFSFIIFYIFSVLIQASINTFSKYDSASDLIIYYSIAQFIFLWFIFAQGAKREHDLGNSGWWQLIPLRFLWLIFLKGNVGPNRFGNDPKE